MHCALCPDSHLDPAQRAHHPSAFISHAPPGFLHSTHLASPGSSVLSRTKCRPTSGPLQWLSPVPGMLLLHVLWPKWDSGAWSGHLLVLVPPAFRPRCCHSVPGLRSTARFCTGEQVTVLVTRHVSPDTVGTPSVSGMSEPHITLHPHCNPITHGEALTFQGGHRVRPC